MSNQQISRASLIFLVIIGNLNKKIFHSFRTKRGEEVIQKKNSLRSWTFLSIFVTGELQEQSDADEIQFALEFGHFQS